MTSGLFALAFAAALSTQPKPYRFTDPVLDRRLEGQPLFDDLAQFRKLLKTEWLQSNLTDADFDGAIDAVAQDADKRG